jgi:hypothetical protein
VAAGLIADAVKSRGRSRHGCPLCRRAGQRGAYRSAEGAARILRSEITGPACVTALKRWRTCFGNRPSRSAGRFQEGEHSAPCSPLRSPTDLRDAGQKQRLVEGRNDEQATFAHACQRTREIRLASHAKLVRRRNSIPLAERSPGRSAPRAALAATRQVFPRPPGCKSHWQSCRLTPHRRLPEICIQVSDGPCRPNHFFFSALHGIGSPSERAPVIVPFICVADLTLPDKRDLVCFATVRTTSLPLIVPVTSSGPPGPS